MACVFHIVSSFVFINYFIIIIIIIIAFVCNKETIITGTHQDRNRPKPPPPLRATSQTHRQHLIKQIWQTEKKKIEKNWVVAVTGREREPPCNPNLRPTASPRHAAPLRPMQTHQKSSTNPLQIATVEIAKRKGVYAHLALR